MKIPRFAPALAFCLVVFGCNNSAFKGNSSSDNAAKSAKAVSDEDFLVNGTNSILDSTTLSSGLDLVIALDTSGSMDEERLAVENNLSQMMTTLQKGNLDPRIHLIVNQEEDDDEPAVAAGFRFPVDINPTQVARVAEEVDSHNALGMITRTLSGLVNTSYRDTKGQPMPTPLAFRTGAKLEILIISDDNGENDGDTAPQFSNLAKDFDPTNKWNATVSGIIGLPNSVQTNGVCEIAATGQEYITLANKTGGSLLDICAKDWSALVLRFSQDILKRSASIRLSKVPVPASIVVFLDGLQLPATAWTFDAQENRVVLAAGTPYTAGMVLKANYTSAQ